MKDVLRDGILSEKNSAGLDTAEGRFRSSNTAGLVEALVSFRQTTGPNSVGGCGLWQQIHVVE